MSIDAQANAETPLMGAIPLVRRAERTEDIGAAAFDAFFTAEYPRLVTLLTAATGDRTAAEELAQEALLRAHQRWGRVAHYDLPAAWLRRVAMNLAANHRAKRGNERRMLLRLARQRPKPAPTSTVDGDEFWSFVRRLPRRQGDAVTLYYLEDRSVAEVAAVLGCAEGTAKAHLHKGRANLAHLLENRESTHER